MSDSKIEACPFCGHVGLDFRDGNTHRWGIAECAGCGASAGDTRREYPDTGAWHAEAIKQWNTRSPVAYQDSRAAALEEAEAALEPLMAAYETGGDCSAGMGFRDCIEAATEAIRSLANPAKPEGEKT